MFFRFFSRNKDFTFWHFSRTSSYTHKHRQVMADYKKQYLDHLERWLNYEEASSTPPIVEEGQKSPPKKPSPPKPRLRVDSVCFTDASSFLGQARLEIAHEVAKKNQRATNEPIPASIEMQNQNKTMTHKIKSLLGL
ncbi:hypothetical protein N0V91_010922 [Didymella pomorum]|uniref:Uncharacterized protein n=1 Tax=Didymella pomorum TaxID=749634 RepID=A0A9W9CZJ3_9PLEO|nr:hypothetical protein N0V91_010922 [Didymella pomorum]